MEKKIYLVLTQTGSVLSSIIRLFTRAEFNHISVALSPDLEPMYSFGRLRPYNPWIGGYVKEYPNRGTYLRFPKTTACVLELPVPEECYKALSDFVEEMYERKKQFRYNFLGLSAAAFHIYWYRKDYFYCSEFVRFAVQNAKIPGFERLKNITAPCDFIQFPRAKVIYRGLFSEFSQSRLTE